MSFGTSNSNKLNNTLLWLITLLFSIIFNNSKQIRIMQAIAGISASAIFSFLAASFFSSAYQQYRNNKQNPQTSTEA